MNARHISAADGTARVNRVIRNRRRRSSHWRRKLVAASQEHMELSARVRRDSTQSANQKDSYQRFAKDIEPDKLLYQERRFLD